MAATEKKELKKRTDNLSDWYTDVVQKAQLADYGPVRGTMIIRPYGYAIWEQVQAVFNEMLKNAEVENAYFPLFIPYSLLKKEESHVEGFAPELALVTVGGGEELAEPLVVRPTSETIMYEMYKNWISSWRDLPLKINQWNNAVRWEKRTMLFLRTTEFLWQEGHTAHATEGEALDMANQALEWYRRIYEDYYAIPVLLGTKSASERFAGAADTFTAEALMPDGKALQAATSHALGQKFSKTFDIKFQNKEGSTEHVWQTSWGLSTRSLGGLFLTHGDDDGLIMPPKIAPIQVIIIPIAGSDNPELFAYVDVLSTDLKQKNIRSKLDNRDFLTPGRKFNEWEVKGVPLRLEIGPKEVEENTATAVRRDTGEKLTIVRGNLNEISHLLDDIQQSMFSKASQFLKDNIREAKDYEEFKKIMTDHKGFIKVFWNENEESEKKIKEETKATSRLKLITSDEEGEDFITGASSNQVWIFAQAY